MFKGSTKQKQAAKNDLQLKNAPTGKSSTATKTDAAPEKKSVNIIGFDTVVEGNIKTEGEIQIEGTIKGDVTTKHKLIVGRDAVIEGNILAADAEVAGKVKGTV